MKKLLVHFAKCVFLSVCATKVPIGKGTEDFKPQESIIPSGLFQPKANTRISAVATLEEIVGSPYLDSIFLSVMSEDECPVDESAPMHLLKYNFKVYHNPYAKIPISSSTFPSVPQLVKSVSKPQMEWLLLE